MIPCNMYEFFIASSNDALAEKEVIYRVCQQWNHTNIEREKAGIQPRTSEYDGYPDLTRPQSQLNKRLDKCDVVVAVVWYAFGAGLVEELERSIEKGKPIMVYFNEKDIPFSKVSNNETNVEAINKFKEKYKEGVYWWPFKSRKELKTLFADHLHKKMIEIIEHTRQTADSSQSEASGNSQGELIHTPQEIFDILLLSENDPDRGFRVIECSRNNTYAIECNGKFFNNESQDHRQKTFWEEKIVRVMTSILHLYKSVYDSEHTWAASRLERFERVGMSVSYYELSGKGYNAIDALKKRIEEGKEPVLQYYRLPRK